MNKLSIQKSSQIIGLLVEGNSMRSVTRLVGCSINTVTKLLVDAGTACAIYQNEVMRDLPCKRIQCDEIWAFCGMKERNVPKEHEGELGYGDALAGRSFLLLAITSVPSRPVDHMLRTPRRRSMAFSASTARNLASPKTKMISQEVASSAAV